MTGGSRAKTSHVFMLNWSKVDEPEKGVYYPRFNFLSPQLVPPDGPDRDTYIDSVSKILIADKQGGDSYFVNKGRAALTGFMHLIVARINEQGDYSGVPTPWVGKEASLPMLAMWLAQAQYIASKGGEEEDWDDGGYVGPDDERPQPPEKDPNRDVIGDWLQELCASVDPSVDGPGRSQRAFMELSPMIKMADKERSGILGTMDEALLSFKNSAVQQRTAACDFTPDDLRGIIDPAITARTKLPRMLRDKDADGREVGEERPNPHWLDPKGEEYAALFKDKANWKPVSLYVCINQADAKSFATITALLFECLSLSLLATGPGETNTKTMRKTGPYPVCFLLDEFAKMPKIDAVI